MEHFSTGKGTADLQYVKIQRNVELVKSRISPQYGKKVIRDCEKNLEGAMSKKGEDVKNLTGAYKSETWFLHQESWFEKHTKKCLDTLCAMVRPHVAETDVFGIGITDSWYARYTDESVVAPHSHNKFYGHYAFCWYLETEPDGTLLYFQDGEHTFPHRFYPGDIIMFPGDLMHWSNDTSKNRKIISGNFMLSITPNETANIENI